MKYVNRQHLGLTSATMQTTLDTLLADEKLTLVNAIRTSDFTSGAADYILILTTVKL